MSKTDTCSVCGDEFNPDSSGRSDRMELNLGKPGGYCSLGCLLDGEMDE